MIRALAVLLACALSGCAWTVRPPAEPANPVPVFLTEYGRHTRLALPEDQSHFVEYGFGDWEFYGLEKNNTWSGLRALFGGGTAAQSRRMIPYTTDLTEFLRLSGGARGERLLVDRDVADSLRAQLDARWAGLTAERVERKFDGVQVSRDPGERYHLFHNSNHMTAIRLRSLGATVRGVPILSNFRVIESRGDRGAENTGPTD